MCTSHTHTSTRKKDRTRTWPIEQSPYRYLYGKIADLHYDAANQTLSDPVNIITRLPAGDDHDGGRLKIGPGNKLHFTTGDPGHNKFGISACTSRRSGCRHKRRLMLETTLLI